MTEWNIAEKETILIYGNAKVGKTFAYCSIIDDTLKRKGKVYLINTDNGVSKTLKQYFGDNFSEYVKNINYYFVNDMKQVIKITDEIHSIINPEDLVVIDLLSDFWEMAQNRFLEEASGNNVIGYIEKIARGDSKNFGILDSAKWSYVKKLDSYIIDRLVVRPVCDVVGICSQKDIEVERAISRDKNKSIEYESAGYKPAGQPTLSYRFNTIIFLGKTQKGEQHYFQIMGDRGAVTNQGMISYEKDFWESFNKERTKRYVK